MSSVYPCEDEVAIRGASFSFVYLARPARTARIDRLDRPFEPTAMTEIVLVHVLAATAGAAFGLLAIWAGLGRHHWCVRFIPVAAVIVSLFPVPAFDLALVFVTQALVVVVPLLLVRRFTLPPADGKATEAPPRSHAWRRFSIADLFRATLLISTVFGVLAYLPGEVRESWWKYALVGGGFGVATLAGAWAALAHRPWWVRLGVVCLVAPLAGIPTALDKTTYVEFRDQGWPWCAVTAIAGLLVVLWLCLAKSTGLTALRRTEFGPIGQTTPTQSVGMARGRRASVALVSLAILLLPGVAYYDMTQPAPIPNGSPPEPNAYDDLLRIAAVIQNVGTPGGNLTSGTEQPPSTDERRRVLFDELHSALGRLGVVSVRYQPNDARVDENQTLRPLARALLAEGDRRRLARDVNGARRIYLDLVELGLASSRGGMIIDRHIGMIPLYMGIGGLRQLRDVLSPDQRRAMIPVLQANEAGWEPLADAYARDLAWQHHARGWPARIRFVNPPDTNPLIAYFERRRLAWFRILVCELALAQYIGEHGGPPENLAGLVTQYLPKVPEDPFSGRPLVYRTEPTGYVLYSVGQNGHDDGGQRGVLFTDGDLFLDPAPQPWGDDGSDD